MTGKNPIKDYKIKRDELLQKQGYCCYSCGKVFTSYSEVQLAHRLIRSKPNLNLYGYDIIDHVLNLRATHGGKCNDAVIMNRATKPIEAMELIEEIRKQIAIGGIENGK
jgi:transposase-like protein